MPIKSPFLDDDEDAIAALRFFRYLAAVEPRTLDGFLEYDENTGRCHWGGMNPDHWKGNPLVKVFDGIALDHKDNARLLVFLVERAQEFQQARPTLLRFAAELWANQVTGRQENQRALRRAAIWAIVLRSASEGTDNVLMSWDSLAKMIELMTDHRPGDAAIKRLFQWLNSDESPFKITRKGKKNALTRPTKLRVTLPPFEDWQSCLDRTEQDRTVAWLADNDRVLGELVADEARRKADRPALKGRLARAAELKDQLDQWDREASSIFASSNYRNVKATSLWGLTPINEEEVPCIGLDQGPTNRVPWEPIVPGPFAPYTFDTELPTEEPPVQPWWPTQPDGGYDWRAVAQRQRGTGEFDLSALVLDMVF